VKEEKGWKIEAWRLKAIENMEEQENILKNSADTRSHFFIVQSLENVYGKNVIKT
jgi:hypothetical protein